MDGKYEYSTLSGSCSKVRKEGIEDGGVRKEDSDSGKDEDIPEDFFDDFLKEDFMAGLDIVDEDNEDLEEEIDSKAKKLKVEKKQESRETRVPRGKIDHVKNFRESPPGQNSKPPSKKKFRKLKDRDDELKQLDKELEEIRNAPLKIPEKCGVDADNFDIRRDPEKTRQAIQRDKIKTAKDKEKRLITDIVETGLVPPGMELEVGIEEVRRIERSEKPEHVTDLRAKIRARKSKSKSFDNSVKSTVKKRSPPQRKSPTSIKRIRSRVSPVPAEKQERKKSSGKNQSPFKSSGKNQSPFKKSPVENPSTFHHGPRSKRSRSFHRHRSPLLTRTPELVQIRPSPPRRNRSPLRRTRSPHRSPLLRRRSRSRSFTNRRRSPAYRTSRDRERLIGYRGERDRSYNTLNRGWRRRTRSRSPRKSKKEEKISFLQELVAKLNETHPVPTNMPPMAPMPPQVNYMVPTIPQPIVNPVPPVVQPQVPVNFFTPTPITQPLPIQPIQKYDPYDESFFIGGPAPTTGLGPMEMVKPALTNPISTQTNGIPRCESDTKRDISKLFGDKRIKLSDFLAITAKPQVNNASTAKLQEKIKVIQRCQDATKVLGERKFAGPLVVHQTDSFKYSKDVTVSPLLKKPIVQLPFTTPGMKNSIQLDFTRCCETLLYRVGLQKRLTPVKLEEKVNIIQPKEKTLKDTPLPISKPKLKQHPEPPIPFKITQTKSSSTQTDKELSSCKECLRRKGILYSNCGIQAGTPTLTFSVCTQVTEADFYSMIPRTQSLASLTPAQLLGKQSMIADLTKLSSMNFDHLRVSRNANSQDLMSRARQIPSPPPPPPMFQFPTLQSFQNDPPYPAVYGQSVIPSLMQGRPSAPSKSFTDDRRGGFNKRY